MKKLQKKIKKLIPSKKLKDQRSSAKLIKSPKMILAAGTAGGIILIIIIIIVSINLKQEEVVYRENKAEFGELSVGITESASVDMETVTQEFSLDISALIRKESDSSGQEQNMAASPMGQMGNGVSFPAIMGMGVSYSSQSAYVTVEKILVSTGQKVKAGDPLLQLTEDSVEEIRSQLEADLTEAKNDLDSIESDQKSSRLEAQQNYDSSILYGKFARTEYEDAIQEAQQKADELAESQKEIEEELALYETKLENAKNEYAEAVLYCTNITETLDAMDVYDDPAWYASLEGTRIAAQETVYSLESQIKRLEENVEKSREELENITCQRQEAERQLELTGLTAKRDYDLRMLASDTAGESYEISIGYLEEEASQQQKAYDNAKEKMDAFDSAISEYCICAEEDGVITQIDAAVGERITTGTDIVTMYTENVTLTVSLKESDAENVTEESVVKVTLTSYPDLVFDGKVSEISDAQYDNSTGTVYYDITVSIDGSSQDLYQGMTGEVTFVTKETKEVTYISNRAVSREGTRSYVKVKDENGKIVKKEIITGFSDGANVEVKEGLTRGDTVLIESKERDT